MGCDIHPIVETFDGERWSIVRVPWSIWDDHLTARLYPAFGVLAGVRDYNVRPISEPKGIPFDTAWKENETKEFDIHCPPPKLLNRAREVFGETSIETAWLGYHSFSYVSLRELEQFNWTHPPLTKQEPWRIGNAEMTARELAAARRKTRKELRESLSWWRVPVIAYLRSLVKPGMSSDDVRLVFGFDS